MGSGTHTMGPISLGIRKWEWYGNSMGPAYHKGVPLLAVPENPIDNIRIPMGLLCFFLPTTGMSCWYLAIGSMDELTPL